MHIFAWPESMQQEDPLSEFLLILSIAVALGCDAFAVGMAIGTTDPDRRQSFRLYFHFGLFQLLMTLIGWEVGRRVLTLIEAYDHWIAFALLSFIAFRMLRESLKAEDEEEKERSDPTKGWSLVSLSVATSMDALGVGFGMSVTGDTRIWPAVVIGIIAALMTYVGIKLGRRLSIAFGKRVETFGALILFGIAIRLLWI